MMQPLQSVIVFVFLPVKEKKKITLVPDNYIQQSADLKQVAGSVSQDKLYP